MDGLLLHLDNLLILFFGALALAGAVAMLLLSQPMRVAMALITTMVSLAAIYGLIGVHFIAAFQVLIYVGAVMVFMVYVILLLEARDARTPRFSTLGGVGVIGAAMLLAALVASVWPHVGARPSPTAGGFGMARFAARFLDEYWLHFELSSVLLLAAVVAALAVIRVGRRARAEERHHG